MSVDQVRVELGYGRGILRAELPAARLAARVVPLPGLRAAGEVGERDLVLGALRRASLREFVRGGRRLAVVVSDATRVVRTHCFLEALLDEVNAGGVADAAVDVVFALGAHRRQSREEMASLLGEAVLERVRVHQHDASAPDLVHLGTTSRGTPVRLNPLVAEADRVVVTGAVTFHDFAGYSGGRKSLIPGVAGLDTIRHNHQLLLLPGRGSGRHPRATAGVRDGNPVHEDMLEGACLLPRVFAVQVVAGEDGRIAFAAAGGLREAHAEAVGEVDRWFKMTLPHPADVVIAGAGGFPKDVSFYQATRTVEPILRAVRPGGQVVLAAECPEGLGDPDFAWWLEHHCSPAEMEDTLRQNFQVCGFIAYALWCGMDKVTFSVVTALDPSDLALTRLNPAASLQEAVDRALDAVGPGARVYLMPDASLVLPVQGDR